MPGSVNFGICVLKLELTFCFPLPNGLHARPASHLQALANRYQAAIRFTNERSGREADAKSVLSLVACDVKQGDACRFTFDGSDAVAAQQALAVYLNGEFLKCDEALPVAARAAGEIVLPRSLRAVLPKTVLTGRPLGAGIGQGCVVVIGGLKLPAALTNVSSSGAESERQKFKVAVSIAAAVLEQAIAQSRNAQEREILQAQLAILQDCALADKVHELLGADVTVGAAIVQAGEFFSATLRAAESAYLRERVLDVTDVCNRLLVVLSGQPDGLETVLLTAPSVCVAEHLTPGQFLALDRAQLKALVLGDAGATSHTVILARSFGVPTLGGVAGAVSALAPGQEVIVDADHGVVMPELSEPLRRHYQRELAQLQTLQAQRQAFGARPAVTVDGHTVEIGVNLASAAAAAAGFAAGADGVGLFRTEMLFMDRERAPTEAEQAAIYSAVVQAAAGRPVIIRLLDIGGDKPVAYLGLPPETNPFLGHRGVRLYAEFAEMVKTQLRALLRASQHGPLKIMVPMISRVEEMRAVKNLLAEARQELAGQGIERLHPVELGAMLEVPAVAFCLPELAREADFFSIGTNDLTQYFFAVDRDNAKVAGLYSPAHPAFLRLLKQLVEQAHVAGRWIGLCGELGENRLLLPVLIGLGLDEISLSPPGIGAVKAAIAQLEYGRCRAFVEPVLAAATESAARALLENFSTGAEAAPLTTPELVLLDSKAQTKAEAIRELVLALQRAGRTAQPDLIEEQIWLREETYSTGFGGGFAIPHCQSEQLQANTLAILKNRNGIEWGSLDGQPVHIVFLLAVRRQSQGKEHLKLLAKLSRLVMRDEFQARLRNAETSPATVDYILSCL